MAGPWEQLFHEYDAIVSSAAGQMKPSPIEPNPSPPPDEPPWWSPQDLDAKSAPPLPPPPPPPQAQKNLRDDEADRAEAAEKLLNERFKRRFARASFKQDEEGLVKAYNDETAPGVFYDPATQTEYVKGSSTARDWYDDVTKIPFWGDTRKAERYEQAEQAYKDLQAQGKPVHRVVGHSLGGSVALQLQSDRGIPQSRTFGAPVLDLNPFGGRVERYRHPLDPVSILDRKATWGKFKPYSHTYTGYENKDV
jgi:hypothetical protein